MNRLPARSGDEQDATSRNARRVLCYLQRSGATARVKQRIRRRERHEARHELRGAW